jgi:FG-GAP-like repeat
LVDFDGKGRLDLITGSNCCDQAGFHVFRRKEDGSWARRRRLDMTFQERAPHGIGFLYDGPILQWQTFVTAADWNGDGVPDLLCVAPGGERILVALGPFKENEPIAFSKEIDFTPKGLAADFAVADWDRDGKPDLLVRQRLPGGKGGIYWFKNLGGAGLAKLAEGKLLVGEDSLDGAQGFCVCDWNGDGWPDLIVTRSEQTRPPREDKPAEWRGTVWLYLRE